MSRSYGTKIITVLRNPVLRSATCGRCRRGSACRYDCLCFLVNIAQLRAVDNEQDSVGDGIHLENSTKQRIVSDSVHIMWKHYIMHKTWRLKRITLSPRKGRATATGNMYRKFYEIWTCGFWDMRVDKQTNRHADHNTLHPTVLPRVKQWTQLYNLDK